MTSPGQPSEKPYNARDITQKADQMRRNFYDRMGRVSNETSPESLQAEKDVTKPKNATDSDVSRAQFADDNPETGVAEQANSTMSEREQDGVDPMLKKLQYKAITSAGRKYILKWAPYFVQHGTGYYEHWAKDEEAINELDDLIRAERRAAVKAELEYIKDEGWKRWREAPDDSEKTQLQETGGLVYERLAELEQTDA